MIFLFEKSFYCSSCLSIFWGLKPIKSILTIPSDSECPLNQLSSSLLFLAGTNEVMRLIISRNLLQNSWHGWIDKDYFLLIILQIVCVDFNCLTAILLCISHFTRHIFLGNIYFFQNYEWIPIWYTGSMHTKDMSFFQAFLS